MTLIAFELSGETPEIPTAEIVGVLESENIPFSFKCQLEQVFIIETPGIDAGLTDILASRLAMTRHIIEVSGVSPANLTDIISMAEKVDFSNLNSLTYIVRAKKIKRKSHISSEDIERGIGKVLYDRGYRADLVNPCIQYRAIVSDNTCIFGPVIASIDSSAFERRKPHNKPFFYPGVLMPKLAQALVNIARVKEGSVVLDPYCGTGGIMVEAGLIGASTLGCDVQRKVLIGAKINLDFYSVNYSLMFQDAGSMALRNNCVDCIVTDPPYGRSALIQARSLDTLMQDSLCEMYRVLRPKGRLVLVSERPVETWAQNAGFRMADLFTQRVHRSLTRRITVLDK
ncbi:MAG: THUMP domain-containing protein [ANME-2 cluster archaeon]|nr:THUMP domain-containing protein [ANME-2 cluster archaeon]